MRGSAHDHTQCRIDHLLACQLVVVCGKKRRVYSTLSDENRPGVSRAKFTSRANRLMQG